MSRRSSSVTIRDVARAAGVSVATVSRYINHNTPVSPEVTERLDKVMGELRYVPHPAARNLASRKTRVVGLLLNNLRNDFFIPLLNGVEKVVSQKEYNLIIATYHIDSRNAMRPLIGPHNTDGSLVFSDGISDDELFALNASSFPVVLVHRTPPPSLSIPCVTIDNDNIMQQLIEHLIKAHNRRRILFLRGPASQEDAIRRERAYRTALEANGIPIDEQLLLDGGFDRNIAYQSMNEYLSSGKRFEFDAVFTGSDDAAIGALRALHQHNIRIPEDVSVAGFDDLDFARFLNPPLTTVRAPTEAVGRIAAERLFDLLETQSSNEAAPSDNRLVLPTEIVYRRSCGCPFEHSSL